MNNQITERGMSDLLALFEDVVSPEDVVLAKITSQICTALSSERIRRSMTQKEFADFLGVKQSQVSSWEHGACNFSLKTIAKLAAKLDLNVNFYSIPRETERAIIEYNEAYEQVTRFKVETNPSTFINIRVSAPTKEVSAIC